MATEMSVPIGELTKLMREKIIENSRSPDGTWSYAFLREVENSLVKFTQEAMDELVNALVLHMFEDECASLSRFKIAQLLGCFKLWKASLFEHSIANQTRLIEKNSDLLTGAFSGPTKQLLRKLIVPDTLEKKKSFSCPPSSMAHEKDIKPLSKI